ncbi:MAG: hypothetical protein Q7R34_03385 [Dehalococcoidia bacterium]|nr:hypothetical protein [Dehalococcoidia bacterium]
MIPFIGQNGYYPPWCKGNGRWVLQRVLTTVKGRLAQADEVCRPDVSYRSLLWAPPRGGLRRLTSMFKRSQEAAAALWEVQFIPFSCPTCKWDGNQPLIDARLGSQSRPMHWLLRCPLCSGNVEPNISGLDTQVIIKKWEANGRPILDPSAAAMSLHSVKPIYDLHKWISSVELPPYENELAYAGQQLWPCFAAFIQDAKGGNP